MSGILSSAFLRSCYKFSIMMTIIFYLPANSDKNNNNNRASDISWKKSKISRDFQGQIRGKIGRFRGIFAGEKSKFAGKSFDFAEFQQKKVKYRRIFRGKFLEKSADFRAYFTANFGGKLRQETIGKKQPISLDFFLANFAKIDQFCVDITSVV